jgi:heme oxygenase (biliverdin-IX-beta and delta-forming)
MLTQAPTRVLNMNARPGAGRGLRCRLRDATAEAHERVNALFGAHELTFRPDYRWFLEANAAALLPLERALVEAGGERLFHDWELRSRSNAILQDLAQVGGTAPPLQLDYQLNDDAIIGAMYVLEGSRLGAKVLVKRVTQSDDPAVAQATAYLRHGEGLSLWRNFVDTLERFRTRRDSDVIGGAHATFAFFERAASSGCGQKVMFN